MCLAVPGQVKTVEQIGLNSVGAVDFGGISRRIFLDFVPDVKPGDYVMVHVGFALNKVNEQEAKEALEMLSQLGFLEEEMALLREEEEAVT